MLMKVVAVFALIWVLLGVGILTIEIYKSAHPSACVLR